MDSEIAHHGLLEQRLIPENAALCGGSAFENAPVGFAGEVVVVKLAKPQRPTINAADSAIEEKLSSILSLIIFPITGMKCRFTFPSLVAHQVAASRRTPPATDADQHLGKFCRFQLSL
jgi:hypothetical protein